jgi:hypothetical protein
MILHGTYQGRFQGQMVFIGYSLREAKRRYRAKKGLTGKRDVVFYLVGNGFNITEC